MREVLDMVMAQLTAIAHRVAHLETLEGGGGGAGGPHELLSATHSDSAPDTVVRGDLITGQQVNPVWQRLAAGAPSQVLVMGAADPAWGAVPGTHAAVTLDGDAAVLLDLSTQEIGLDTQNANTVFAGPTTGAANEPTFRALVAADLAAHTHARPRTIVFEFVGTLSLATGTIRIYPDGTWAIDKVWISVSVAPTGANIIVDVHKNGTTIFTDQGKRPQIAAGAYTDESDTPDVTALTKTDYLTMDVDQVGSTITGQDLTVHVRAKETI
jgi:hypothetical protein